MNFNSIARKKYQANYLFTLTLVLIAMIFANLTYSQSKGQNDVKVIQNKEGFLEITNGLLGILTPSQKSFNTVDKKTLAPIQSFIYANGVHSDNTYNYLKLEVKPYNINVKSVVTPGKAVVTFLYLFHKPAFTFYNEKYKGGEAGPGYYKCTMTVTKGSKSITIDEDSDFDFFYEVKLSKGLNPNEARYRGWRSDSPENGFEGENQIYRDESNRGYPMDARITLNFDKFKVFPYLSLWDPTGGEVNTGRYWLAYNSQFDLSSSLFGYFQGRPSQMIGARSCGIRLIQNINNAQGNLGLVTEENHIALGIEIFRRGPDNVWYPRKRFEWCAFISTKADILAPEKVQPIAKEMNRVSGLAGKINEYTKKPLQVSPVLNDCSFYLPATAIQQIIRKVKTDKSYYDYLVRIDPYFKPVLDAWRFPDSVKSTKKGLLDYYLALKKDLVEQDGVYTPDIRYWKGSYNFKKTALQISSLYADKSIIMTDEEKTKFNELLRLMARIQWDNDNVPFFDSSGVNFGTANMTYQYKNNGRNFFALLFAKDPEFSSRATEILQETRKDLLSGIYENGISFGTPHYLQATIDPILFTMLQLKQAGVADLFMEQKSRLLKFIDFYSSLLTPPSVRFSNYRKLVNFGDGTEESAVTFALLGNGFQQIDSGLSSRMYNIFENGAPRMSQFGEIILAADLTKHPALYKSSSSNYTGYLSHFRSGVNSDNESVAWVINGERYSDHRNEDRGETVIYALKAPLSLSRNCFYYPIAPDARIRSLVIPESLFPGWKDKDQPINGEDKRGNPWSNSGQLEFAKLHYSSVSVSRITQGNTTWIRKLVLLSIQDDEPIFIYYDSLNNKQPNIWSMLFMSDGAIGTPSGNITPPDKVYSNDLQQLPEGTPEKVMNPGWNIFHFMGQHWRLHPGGGINWDMHTYSSVPSSFSLAQWTNTWENSQETDEFMESNKKPYSEKQQIFRWKNDQPFFAIIVPSNKTAEPAKATGTAGISSSCFLTGTKGKYAITPKYIFYTANNGRKIIETLSDSKVYFSGITISGGISEVEIFENKMIIRIHGNSGIRTIETEKEIYSTDKNPAINIQKKDKLFTLKIDFRNKEMDLMSDKKGYVEFEFTLK